MNAKLYSTERMGLMDRKRLLDDLEGGAFKHIIKAENNPFDDEELNCLTRKLLSFPGVIAIVYKYDRFDRLNGVQLYKLGANG